jgi:hypothetical protein
MVPAIALSKVEPIDGVDDSGGHATVAHDKCQPAGLP